MTSRIESRPLYWTDQPAPANLPPLTGRSECDVGVVGAGLAGISAALCLAERGYKVTVLEAQQVGSGASGRSGAQALIGTAASQEKLQTLIGVTDARRVWDMTLEALDLIRARTKQFNIDCDLVQGQMHVALKERQRVELAEWHESLLRDYNYPSLRLLSQAEVRAEVGSERYVAGLLDSNSAHLHPLKYLRGLAAAAQRTGVTIHEHSRVTRWSNIDSKPVLQTVDGELHCRHIVFAGNALLGDTAPALARRIMSVGTYIVATEPLGTALAQQLLPNNIAVTDINWVLDYFRLSRDQRLLFGGRVSYSGRDRLITVGATRRRMLAVFPQLAETKITHAWGGLVDITLNRAPDFGRLAPNVYYLQGFSGHGMALTGLAGQLVAEAIAGTAERFDIFARIPHREFPGGAAFRRPALMLAMLYYRLRDLL